LAGLVTPAVMRARTSARNAAIKAEIDMLHMAIMNYKNEYGSFPPCIDPTGGSNGKINTHLKRLFPRIQLVPDSYLCPNSNTALLTPATALVAWLSGYTDQPSDPLAVGDTTLARSKLFGFDQSRYTAAISASFPFGRGYFPTKKPESPYIYINAGSYTAAPWPPSVVTYNAGSDSYTINPNTYRAQSYNGSTFNTDTFQILCAGRDGIFGEDANMNGTPDAGEDLNGDGVLEPGDDDLSNFWPGTRKDYLDSLKQ